MTRINRKGTNTHLKSFFFLMKLMERVSELISEAILLGCWETMVRSSVFEAMLTPGSRGVGGQRGGG